MIIKYGYNWGLLGLDNLMIIINDKLIAIK